MTSERADVVVVGMGSAGAAAALFLARAGRRVIAIDKRPAGETGARWVNAVPRWCFERAGVPAPSGEALFGGHAPAPDHAFHLVAPGGDARLTLPTPPVLHVDMRRLVDGLVRDACDAGVELVRGSVTEVEVARARGAAGDRVTGVRVETAAGVRTIGARLVIDASGLGGAVRRRTPALAAACPDPAPADRCVAAEFQYEVRDPAGLEAFLHAHGARPGHDLAFPGVAGGFSTLTVFTTRELDQVGVLTGSIPASGVADGGELLARFVASAPWIGARLWGGRGAIPVRRPYARLVDAGVALVGDAACQVHVAHGSGVGFGLVAARTLATAVQGADDPGALETLETYERRFHREHGGLLAAADAFRRFVQRASRDDLAALLASGLLEERLASAALAQEPTRPDVRFALTMLPRAARAPGLALRFLPLAARSAVLDRLGGLGGAPRVGHGLSRALDLLVGATPSAAGAGPWSIPGGAQGFSGGTEGSARGDAEAHP